MQPQTASEQDKMVPIDTSGESMDIEIKEEENKEKSLIYLELIRLLVILIN